MKNYYWWIISLIKKDFVGGEGPDDDSYPIKIKKIFKFFGPNNKETYQKIFSAIADEEKEVDFVWCLGSKGEELSFSEDLKEYLITFKGRSTLKKALQNTGFKVVAQDIKL
jgi:hypothetical protein